MMPDDDQIVLRVCVTCRSTSSDTVTTPGQALFEALKARADRLGPSVSVRPVQCLSVCSRPCAVSLSGPDRYTYVFGDVDPTAGADALTECVKTYRSDPHGYMLWRERPESLRRGIVARIPSLGWSSDDGSHPR